MSEARLSLSSSRQSDSQAFDGTDCDARPIVGGSDAKVNR